MPVLSDTFVSVVLPSGNKAVFEVTPLHLTTKTRLFRSEFIRLHAKQRAHQLDGSWYEAGGWQPITDLKTIALLERCPEIDD